MKIFKYLLMCLAVNLLSAQDYTSFFIGDTNDLSTNPEFGICLMGGAGESDEAMQWFLNLADGGDVLVLRASGGDGYNDYMFNQLGVNLNSVETIRVDNSSGATSAYVLQKISQAEAIWFAGGDQADYVNFFKDNAVEDLLNEHINIKQYPIGGISAGMAIMGEYYFDALNGTVTTTQALNNPYDSRVSLGHSDFLNNPLLEKVITDTHYDNPFREGRHMAFLARLQEISGERVFGIGIDEFTAVCIDENGTAKIFGDFPNFDDYAYFIQVNCLTDSSPENLVANQTLNWNLGQQAVKAYKVAGTTDGSNQFDLNTWESGIGGEWQNWWVDQGNFQFQSSSAIDCTTFSTANFNLTEIEIYPNPTRDILKLQSRLSIQKAEIFDLLGKKIRSYDLESTSASLELKDLKQGLYVLKVVLENSENQTFKIIKN